LIYSASASTAVSPEIFRQLDEENVMPKPNPNPSHKTTIGSTTSLQSMLNEPESKLQQPDFHAGWVVPQIQLTCPTTSKGTKSPASFCASEDVSELESPMLFSATTEASDIQSSSQATDIYSLRPTPTNTFLVSKPVSAGYKNHQNVTPVPEITPAATTQGSEATERSYSGLPGRLVRCDAQDEQDEEDVDVVVSVADIESNSGDTPKLPSLTQLASSSGILISRKDVVEAAYEPDSHEILTEDPYIRRLQQRHIQSTLQGGTQTNQQKTLPQWRVHSQLFFQSPNMVQFNDMDEDDGMISELSSHQGDQIDGRDLEHGQKPNEREKEDKVPPASPTSLHSGKTSGSSSYTGFLFARSRIGLACRLLIIAVLTVCVIAPLIFVFLDRRGESSPNAATLSNNTDFDGGSVELTPTAAPVVSSMPQNPTTGSSQTYRPTQVSTVSTTQEPTHTITQAPTASPTVAPTALPTLAGQPTLPPYSAIWVESTWASQGEVSGPRWPTRRTSPLELTVINSLTDANHSIILEETVQNWAPSGLSFKVISDPPITPLISVAQCIPTLGRIRICNGDFGDTPTRFFSNVYVDEQQKILAATILQNDGFGLEGLGVTTESLTYNYCHELGHTLGLFHTSRGCMAESIQLDTLADGLFVLPDESDLVNLASMYGL
jgi:hypothetical protein